MVPVKTSSFPRAGSAPIETVYVRLPGGRIVPRLADELVARPAPPAAGKAGEP